MRRRLPILALLLLVAVLASTSAWAATGLTYRQLSGSTDDDRLKALGTTYVSGDRVVWATGPRLDDALMVLDFAEATPSVVMTSPYGEDLVASMSGDLLAVRRQATWSGKSDIYLLDLVSRDVRKITPSRGYHEVPSVSSRWVAWAEGGGMYARGTDLRAYRLQDGATFTVPAEVGPYSALSLDGDLLAWQEGPSIVVYDLERRTELYRSSDGTPACGPPTLGEGWVAWPSAAAGGYYYYGASPAWIRAHHLASGRDISLPTSAYSNDGMPPIRISDGRAYWLSRSRVMSSLLDTATPRGSIAFTAPAPWIASFDVDEDHIVWQQYGSSGPELWGTYTATIATLGMRADRTTVPYAGTVRLTGTTTLPEGAQVWLERLTSTYGPQYGRVRAVTVSGGRVSTALTLKTGGTYRFAYAGSPSFGRVTSTSVRLMPYARMTWPVPTAAPVRNKRCTLTGTIAPALSPYSSGAGMKLEVQRRVDGQWVRVVTAKAARSSRIVKGSQAYSGSFIPGRRGTYRARAIAGSCSAHARTLSAWRSFTVR